MGCRNRFLYSAHGIRQGEPGRYVCELRSDGTQIELGASRVQAEVRPRDTHETKQMHGVGVSHNARRGTIATVCIMLSRGKSSGAPCRALKSPLLAIEPGPASCGG